MTTRAAKPKAAAPIRAARPRDPLLLGNQLCFALYSTQLAMNKLYRPLLDALGLTYPQYLVMLVLWESDAQTLSDIGARLYLDSATLTPLLKRMEAQGLLRRERDAGDERRVILSLTAEGRALRAKAERLPGAVLAAADCSLGELADLQGRLEGLRTRLMENR